MQNLAEDRLRCSKISAYPQNLSLSARYAIGRELFEDGYDKSDGSSALEETRIRHFCYENRKRKSAADSLSFPNELISDIKLISTVRFYLVPVRLIQFFKGLSDCL